MLSNVRVWFAVTCLIVLVSSSAFAEKKHPAEEKELKSLPNEIDTKINFINKSGKTIKVYWIDFDGDRKLYHTLDKDDSYEQDTFVNHAWVITDEDDNAWYVYFPDAQPRTIEIVAPKKK